jgi:hypothetical protein
MNLYVVIEGERASKKIYKNWITYVNPKLNFIDYLPQLSENNFYILAGYGQPYFFKRIEDAIKDINQVGKFDRLVVSLDSENSTFDEKFEEVKECVKNNKCPIDFKIIVQHFCLETWLLGNKGTFRKKPSDIELKKYYSTFNVRDNDPELLPEFKGKNWNRSQFAYEYLRAGFRDTYTNRHSYTKKNPGIVWEESYFHGVKDRLENENHISSFKNFISAFL